MLGRTLGTIALLGVVGCSVKGLPAGSAVGDSACPSAQVSAPTPSRHINLVLDDSGSMFKDPDNTPSDRWSVAKYSLEVFAAMLGERDSLDVYRMSDFADDGSKRPAITLAGSETTDERAEDRDMPLVGRETPYASIQTAYDDIRSVDSPNKWLVVLTDGALKDAAGATLVRKDVEKELSGYTKETPGLSVDFVAIGENAQEITGGPGSEGLLSSRQEH